MKLRKILCIAMAAVLTAGCAMALGGCSKKAARPELNANIKTDTAHKIGYQLEKPADGEEVAILHTTMGDITLRFFPENAPKAVENFKALAKDGKYDGTIFHRVIKDFMLQGGDYENADGTGGTSSFGEAFEDEFCNTLYNIRGSVAMANSGENTNGSQFFINQAGKDSFKREDVDYDKTYDQYKDMYNQYVASYGMQFVAQYADADAFIKDYIGGIHPLSYAIPEEVWKLYEENGGNIHLDGALRSSGGHTVFAQVIEGMDVVDKIADVEVDEEANKPKEDVKITKVELTTYKAK